MANPYKTHWYDRQPAYWLSKNPERDSGVNQNPELIRLDPVPGHEVSSKPPVRIFMGTEPRQYRATRVFVWSVMKHRDPGRCYEIYLMSDLAGIDRTGWKTGFTNYRYAIPYLAGMKGRAIYNDVDQIYLRDPGELFDLDMQNRGVLAISPKENSVMLIDCARMASIWTIEDVRAGHLHDHFKNAVTENGLHGDLAGIWNSRDGEYPIGQTGCLHYTTLHTQPWRPFPDVLRYRPSALAHVWHDLENEADRAGYLMFTRSGPAKNAITANPLENGPGAAGAGARPALDDHLGAISKLIEDFKAKTLLDYGVKDDMPYAICPQEEAISPWRAYATWPGVRVYCYQPGGGSFGALPETPCDGAVSIGLLECFNPFDVPWAIDEIFSHARRFVFVAVTCYGAPEATPDGHNVHRSMQPPHWWHTQMALAARRYPDIAWHLACIEKGRSGPKTTIITKTTPSPLD